MSRMSPSFAVLRKALSALIVLALAFGRVEGREMRDEIGRRRCGAHSALHLIPSSLTPRPSSLYLFASQAMAPRVLEQSRSPYAPSLTHELQRNISLQSKHEWQEGDDLFVQDIGPVSIVEIERKPNGYPRARIRAYSPGTQFWRPLSEIDKKGRPLTSEEASRLNKPSMSQRALTAAVTVAASPLGDMGVDPDSVVLSPEKTALRFLGRGDVDNITKVLVLGGMPVLEVEAFQEVLGGFHDRRIDLEDDLREHGLSKTRAPRVASRIIRSLIKGLQTLMLAPASQIPARQFDADGAVADMTPTPAQLSAARWWQSVLENYFRSLAQTPVPAPNLLSAPAPIPAPEDGDLVEIGGIEYEVNGKGADFSGSTLLNLSAAGGDLKGELNQKEVASLRLVKDIPGHRTYLLPFPDPAPSSGMPAPPAPVRKDSRRVNPQSLWDIIQSSEGKAILELLRLGDLTSRRLYDLLQSLEHPVTNGYASVVSILISLAQKKGFRRHPPEDKMDPMRYEWIPEPAGNENARKLETDA